jgi:hypothetical protein
MEEEKDNEVDEMLLTAVRSEMETGEQLLWHKKPVSEEIAFSLLPSPLLWLCGLFVFAIGVMNDAATTDSSRVWSIIIVLLVLVAVFGVLEIISVPAQATRTIYAITDKRVMSVKLKGRFSLQEGPTAGYSNQSRNPFRVETDTFTYWILYTLPMHLIFLYIIYDWLNSLVTHYDAYNLGGFVLLAIGWLLQWYQDLRCPFPQFRDQGNALYIVGEWLVSIQTIKFDMPFKIWMHANKENLGDLFLLSKKGCLRMRWVPDVREAQTMLKERKTIS